MVLVYSKADISALRCALKKRGNTPMSDSMTLGFFFGCDILYLKMLIMIPLSSFFLFPHCHCLGVIVFSDSTYEISKLPSILNLLLPQSSLSLASFLDLFFRWGLFILLILLAAKCLGMSNSSPAVLLTYTSSPVALREDHHCCMIQSLIPFVT